MSRSMLELWGALLDRSFEQIAAASGDAREFDRLLVSWVSDVWDNNTFPFFGAAVARGARRERLAEQGLRWMADFGAERREWVLEQTAACGRRLSLPPPSYREGINYRDYRGLVRPTPGPMTPEVGAGYDLRSARVRQVVVERTGGGLRGRLRLAVDRRFEIDQGDDAPGAELDLQFEGIDELSFALDDFAGVAFSGDAAVAIGASGVLRAARATVWVDDSWWHLSAAGRAADARTPTEARRRAVDLARGQVKGAALVAASGLYRAIIEIRMVRYASYADKIPVHRIARAFAGAGSAVVAAGARRWRRDAAFERLIDGWIAAGGDELAPFFGRASEGERTPSPRGLWTGAVHADSRAREGEVVLVEYAVGNEFRPASLVVQSAVPEGAGWTLRGSAVEAPERFGVALEAGRLVVSVG